MEDPAKLSLGRIFGALTTGQVVAISAFLIGLATTGFSLGYWLAGTAGTVTQEETRLALVRAEAEAEDLRDELSKLRADQAFLQSKAHVLGLAVMWHDLSGRIEAGEEEADLHDKFDGVSDTLFHFVVDAAGRSAAGEAETPVRVRLGKGTSPSLTFERDGSTFPLPGPLFATAD